MDQRAILCLKICRKISRFRAIVFRGAADVFIQSRDLRPLDRYFPELHDSLLETLPEGRVIDGEIGSPI